MSSNNTNSTNQQQTIMLAHMSAPGEAITTTPNVGSPPNALQRPLQPQHQQRPQPAQSATAQLAQQVNHQSHTNGEDINRGSQTSIAAKKCPKDKNHTYDDVYNEAMVMTGNAANSQMASGMQYQAGAINSTGVVHVVQAYPGHMLNGPGNQPVLLQMPHQGSTPMMALAIMPQPAVNGFAVQAPAYLGTQYPNGLVAQLIPNQPPQQSSTPLLLQALQQPPLVNSGAGGSITQGTSAYQQAPLLNGTGARPSDPPVATMRQNQNPPPVPGRAIPMHYQNGSCAQAGQTNQPMAMSGGHASSAIITNGFMANHSQQQQNANPIPSRTPPSEVPIDALINRPKTAAPDAISGAMKLFNGLVVPKLEDNAESTGGTQAQTGNQDRSSAALPGINASMPMQHANAQMRVNGQMAVGSAPVKTVGSNMAASMANLSSPNAFAQHSNRSKPAAGQSRPSVNGRISMVPTCTQSMLNLSDQDTIKQESVSHGLCSSQKSASLKTVATTETQTELEGSDGAAKLARQAKAYSQSSVAAQTVQAEMASQDRNLNATRSSTSTQNFSLPIRSCDTLQTTAQSQVTVAPQVRTSSIPRSYAPQANQGNHLPSPLQNGQVEIASQDRNNFNANRSSTSTAQNCIHSDRSCYSFQTEAQAQVTASPVLARTNPNKASLCQQVSQTHMTQPLPGKALSYGPPGGPLLMSVPIPRNGINLAQSAAPVQATCTSMAPTTQFVENNNSQLFGPQDSKLTNTSDLEKSLMLKNSTKRALGISSPVASSNGTKLNQSLKTYRKQLVLTTARAAPNSTGPLTARNRTSQPKPPNATNNQPKVPGPATSSPCTTSQVFDPEITHRWTKSFDERREQSIIVKAPTTVGQTASTATSTVASTTATDPAQSTKLAGNKLNNPYANLSRVTGQDPPNLLPSSQTLQRELTSDIVTAQSQTPQASTPNQTNRHSTSDAASSSLNLPNSLEEKRLRLALLFHQSAQSTSANPVPVRSKNMPSRVNKSNQVTMPSNGVAKLSEQALHSTTSAPNRENARNSGDSSDSNLSESQFQIKRTKRNRKHRATPRSTSPNRTDLPIRVQPSATSLQNGLSPVQPSSLKKASNELALSATSSSDEDNGHEARKESSSTPQHECLVEESSLHHKSSSRAEVLDHADPRESLMTFEQQTCSNLGPSNSRQASSKVSKTGELALSASSTSNSPNGNRLEESDASDSSSLSKPKDYSKRSKKRRNRKPKSKPSSRAELRVQPHPNASSSQPEQSNPQQSCSMQSKSKALSAQSTSSEFHQIVEASMDEVNEQFEQNRAAFEQLIISEPQYFDSKQRSSKPNARTKGKSSEFALSLPSTSSRRVVACLLEDSDSSDSTLEKGSKRSKRSKRSKKGRSQKSQNDKKFNEPIAKGKRAHSPSLCRDVNLLEERQKHIRITRSIAAVLSPLMVVPQSPDPEEVVNVGPRQSRVKHADRVTANETVPKKYQRWLTKDGRNLAYHQPGQLLDHLNEQQLEPMTLSHDEESNRIYRFNTEQLVQLVPDLKMLSKDICRRMVKLTNRKQNGILRFVWINKRDALISPPFDVRFHVVQEIPSTLQRPAKRPVARETLRVTSYITLICTEPTHEPCSHERQRAERREQQAQDQAAFDAHEVERIRKLNERFNGVVIHEEEEKNRNVNHHAEVDAPINAPIQVEIPLSMQPSTSSAHILAPTDQVAGSSCGINALSNLGSDSVSPIESPGEDGFEPYDEEDEVHHDVQEPQIQSSQGVLLSNRIRQDLLLHEQLVNDEASSRTEENYDRYENDPSFDPRPSSEENDSDHSEDSSLLEHYLNIPVRVQDESTEEPEYDRSLTVSTPDTARYLHESYEQMGIPFYEIQNDEHREDEDEHVDEHEDEHADEHEGEDEDGAVPIECSSSSSNSSSVASDDAPLTTTIVISNQSENCDSNESFLKNMKQENVEGDESCKTDAVQSTRPNEPSTCREEGKVQVANSSLNDQSLPIEHQESIDVDRTIEPRHDERITQRITSTDDAEPTTSTIQDEQFQVSLTKRSLETEEISTDEPAKRLADDHNLARIQAAKPQSPEPPAPNERPQENEAEEQIEQIVVIQEQPQRPPNEANAQVGIANQDTNSLDSDYFSDGESSRLGLVIELLDEELQQFGQDLVLGRTTFQQEFLEVHEEEPDVEEPINEPINEPIINEPIVELAEELAEEEPKSMVPNADPIPIDDDESVHSDEEVEAAELVNPFDLTERLNRSTCASTVSVPPLTSSSPSNGKTSKQKEVPFSPAVNRFPKPNPKPIGSISPHWKPATGVSSEPQTQVPPQPHSKPQLLPQLQLQSQSQLLLQLQHLPQPQHQHQTTKAPAQSSSKSSRKRSFHQSNYPLIVAGCPELFEDVQKELYEKTISQFKTSSMPNTNRSNASFNASASVPRYVDNRKRYSHNESYPSVSTSSSTKSQNRVAPSTVASHERRVQPFVLPPPSNLQSVAWLEHEEQGRVNYPLGKPNQLPFLPPAQYPQSIYNTNVTTQQQFNAIHPNYYNQIMSAQHSNYQPQNQQRKPYNRIPKNSDWSDRRCSWMQIVQQQSASQRMQSQESANVSGNPFYQAPTTGQFKAPRNQFEAQISQYRAPSTPFRAPTIQSNPMPSDARRSGQSYRSQAAEPKSRTTAERPNELRQYPAPSITYIPRETHNQNQNQKQSSLGSYPQEMHQQQPRPTQNQEHYQHTPNQTPPPAHSQSETQYQMNNFPSYMKGHSNTNSQKHHQMGEKRKQTELPLHESSNLPQAKKQKNVHQTSEQLPTPAQFIQRKLANIRDSQQYNVEAEIWQKAKEVVDQQVNKLLMQMMQQKLQEHQKKQKQKMLQQQKTSHPHSSRKNQPRTPPEPSPAVLAMRASIANFEIVKVIKQLYEQEQVQSVDTVYIAPNVLEPLNDQEKSQLFGRIVHKGLYLKALVKPLHVRSWLVYLYELTLKMNTHFSSSLMKAYQRTAQKERSNTVTLLNYVPNPYEIDPKQLAPLDNAIMEHPGWICFAYYLRFGCDNKFEIKVIGGMLDAMLNMNMSDMTTLNVEAIILNGMLFHAFLTRILPGEMWTIAKVKALLGDLTRNYEDPAIEQPSTSSSSSTTSPSTSSVEASSSANSSPGSYRFPESYGSCAFPETSGSSSSSLSSPSTSSQSKK